MEKNKKGQVFAGVVFWVILVCAVCACFLKFLPNSNFLIIGAISGVLALIFAGLKIYSIMSKDPGNERMQQLSGFIHQGAMAFLKREYKILSIFVVLVFTGLYKFVDLPTAVCFICGALCSAFAGFVGMAVSTKANTRTTAAAQISLNKAFDIAFSGGAVMGMTVVGLGLLGLSVLYYIYNDPNIVNGFALGGSSIALFARVGGGIYTKAADVGADLVGKIEAGIPEDDHRNPAVIADNVGDNVGDVAGMGADLFESYVGSIIAGITLGLISLGTNGALLPLIIAAVGIVSSIVATCFVKTKEGANPMLALHFGTFSAMIILIIATYYVCNIMLAPTVAMGVFWAIVIGILVGTIIGVITEYYTSSHYKPVKQIAQATETGAATTIIAGLGTGMLSVFFPIILICGAIIASFLLVGGAQNYMLGVYGVAMSAVGMLATTGMIVAVDAYGPISDNAGGIAEMAGLDKVVRERTDKLDSVGNTTAAIGKGFAIGSAALTALALLCAYASVVGLKSINILDPFVCAGLIFGGCLPFIFCALTMGAVGRAAQKMVDEVRRQFRDIKGIMEDTAQPDYAKCIDISTTSAIMEMIIPGIMAVCAPLVVGIFMGPEALGGMLMGSIGSGVCLAIMMANAGGAWDNAKKFIEGGAHGGKGSPAHAAAVVGDTVGDPFKDTSGPSLNILIKLMTIVSLVCATLFI